MLSDDIAGFWTTAYWASLTVGRIVFGFIMFKQSVHKVLTGCLVAVIAGTCLFASDLSQLVVLAGIIIIGLALAPVFPSLIAMTPARIGVSHAANAVGYQISAAMIGGAILPGFAGIMINAFGIEVISLIHILEAVTLLLLYLAIARYYPASKEKAQ